jgi:mannose/fructose-specific phosphotransferase system component IIA
MKIILASHGSLAEAMLGVLRMIMGDEDDVEALCLDKWENPGALVVEVKKRIDAAEGMPVILVCDIKGGSVFNGLLPLCAHPGVTLFAGMNLDLVLSLVNIQPETPEAFEEVMGEGKAGIARFDRETLDRMGGGNDADDF